VWLPAAEDTGYRRALVLVTGIGPSTGEVGDAMEARPERLRDNLRRPVPGRRDLLTEPPETPFTRLSCEVL
jgi:hypothetical protein